MEASTPAAAAFRVAAFRLLVFAARLRADFSFRFRIAFFAADILSLRMDIPFAVVRTTSSLALPSHDDGDCSASGHGSQVSLNCWALRFNESLQAD